MNEITLRQIQCSRGLSFLKNKRFSKILAKFHEFHDNRLSKILAEITNWLAKKVLELIRKQKLTFAVKFADDSVSALDPKHLAAKRA